MKNNSTNFFKLKRGMPLYLIRYSHHPVPDYIQVVFEGIETKENKTVVVLKIKKDDKYIFKSIGLKKTKFRCFLDFDEMLKELLICYKKRKIELGTDLIEKTNTSKEERPELWI